MSKNYENGQKVAIFYEIGTYVGYDLGPDGTGYIWRGETTLGDQILENPCTGGVLLARQVAIAESAV